MTTSTTSKEFNWPPFHSFPPSYTLQPVLATREKQLSLWCSLVLDFCRFQNISKVLLSEFSRTPLFDNKDINRKASKDLILAIFRELLKQEQIGRVIQNSFLKKHTEISFSEEYFIYWNRPEDWASVIYKWVVENGRQGKVHTMYDLTDDDETLPFYGLENELLTAALKILENRKQAKKFGNGVKFF